MNRMLFGVLVFSVIVLVSGCYTPVPLEYSFANRKKPEGLVVLSYNTSYNEGFFHFDEFSYDLYYQAKCGKALKSGCLSISNGFLFGYGIPGFFDGGKYHDDHIFYDVHNAIVIDKLPPGQYEFVEWAGASSFCSMRSTAPFSIPFTVSDGKATYLGSFLLDRHHSGNKWSMDIRNKAERDIPMFKRHYRNIKDDQIEVKIATFEDWAGKGNSQRE